METVFSTYEVHVRDRFDYWHDVACRSIVNHDSQPECRLTFNAAIQAGALADIGLVVFENSPMDISRTLGQAAHATNDEIFVCRQLSGSLALEQNGRRIVLKAGDFTSDRSAPALRGEVFLRVELACFESSAASTGSPGREDARDGSPPHHSVQRRGQSDVIVSRYAAISRRPDATSHRANHQGSGTRPGRHVADQRDGDSQGKIFISSLGCPDECARRDRDATVRSGSRHRHSGCRRQNQRAVRQCCAGTRGHLDHAPHSD